LSNVGLLVGLIVGLVVGLLVILIYIIYKAEKSILKKSSIFFRIYIGGRGVLKKILNLNRIILF
jgi:hypothetical protein